MIVVCPNKDCVDPKQEYNPKKNRNAKRKRKICHSCGRKFEIKVTRTEDFINKKIDKSIDLTLFSKNQHDISELDRRLLRLIIDDPLTTQKDMRDATNFSQYIISRKLQRLEQLSIIVTKSHYPKTYEVVDPQIAKAAASSDSDKKLHAVESHNIKFNVEILEASPQLVNLGEKKNQLMGWVKKYFHLDNVSIANNNDKSLEFYLPGAGLTEKEALNNAKEKSLKIRDALETKFGCRLAVPTAYPETHPKTMGMHSIPIETDEDSLKKQQELYVDHSHPGEVESKTPGSIDKVNQMLNAFDQVKIDQIQFKQDIADIKQKITSPDTSKDQMLEMFQQFQQVVEKNNTKFEQQFTALNEKFNLLTQLTVKSIDEMGTKMSSTLEKIASMYTKGKPDAQEAPPPPPKDAPNEMYK